MLAGPGRPAGVDDPLPQQQLAQPVPDPHQVSACVFPGPDQVPRRLLGDRGHGDLDDLPELEQPRQVQRVPGVGLDPVAGRALELRGRGHQAHDIPGPQEPGQPEPGRASLIHHRHRLGQPVDPGHHLTGIRRQPVAMQLPGHPVDRTRHHRPGVHVQTNTRTLTRHWGLPQLWLYRTGDSLARQPTTVCE